MTNNDIPSAASNLLTGLAALAERQEKEDSLKAAKLRMIEGLQDRKTAAELTILLAELDAAFHKASEAGAAYHKHLMASLTNSVRIAAGGCRAQA